MENKPLIEIMKEYSPSDNHSGQILDEEFLAHYGVLGMHWGVRRFQPYSLIPRKSGKGGKETGEAKKAIKSSKSSSSGSSGMSRNQKSQVAKEEIEKKALTARQRKEALDRIVNSGNAKEVYEHRSEMSEQQIKDAISRINTEAQLAALVKKQNPSKLDKIKDLAGELRDVNSIVRTGVDSYNIASNIKDISKKNAKARKEEAADNASAETLRKIIEGGNSDADIVALQSKLSKKDLQTAVQRLSSLNAAENSVRETAKRNSQQKQDNREYLKKSLEDLVEGKKRSDEWSSDINPTVEPSKLKVNETAKEVLDRDSKTFKISDKTSKKFDNYFEDEVESTTGINTRKTSGKAIGIKGQKWKTNKQKKK